MITNWHDSEPLFFLIDSFLRLGQKYKNILVGFLVHVKTFKSAFEINWPLEYLKSGLNGRKML